jgi:CheY-like chemotaxis protein
MIARITTVLYQGDKPRFRRPLVSVLGDHGFEAITAACSPEGMRQFRKLGIDLALIDYKVPLLSDAELARKMKVMHRYVPVLVALRTLTSPHIKPSKSTGADWADST